MKPRRVVGIGLMLMSFGSGCMDILSYRFLGDVFPSAMTGNVALMGLSLGQGDVSAAVRNLCAFSSFVVGLLMGSAVLRGKPGRGQFVITLGLQSAVLLAFVLLWGRHEMTPWRYGLIGMAAVAMGMQSAVAHRIGVTGVSTTYFTGTMVNIAFGLMNPGPVDVPASRRVAWPVLAFLSYLVGAVMGGWSIAGRTLHDFPIWLPSLPLAATVILGIIMATERTSRPDAA